MQVTEMQKYESNKWKRQTVSRVDKHVEQVKLSSTAEGTVKIGTITLENFWTLSTEAK